MCYILWYFSWTIIPHDLYLSNIAFLCSVDNFSSYILFLIRRIKKVMTCTVYILLTCLFPPVFLTFLIWYITTHTSSWPQICFIIFLMYCRRILSLTVCFGLLYFVLNITFLHIFSYLPKCIIFCHISREPLYPWPLP